MEEFGEWESFYVIIGAAAGALIGLQFVIMTLIAEKPPPRVVEASAAFASPTVVHFSVALLLSALLRAPWHTIAPVAVLWGLVGIAGVVYTAIVARRVRTQRAYQPDFEDRLFHVLLPLAANAILVASAFAAPSYEREALFAVGAATLLFLFIGIHNAWDAVSYHVLVAMQKDRTR
ncbi:MAG: hypothetical protein QOD26_2281 [Betaproteobacteria bacterium]|jgi:hypothetical protein|nr:hypothetical protein [Betaproteobacteria bacterium]